MSISIAQLRHYVIRPTLLHIGLHSQSAENLVLGTALVESAGKYIKQIGGGPALGFWQMEPATHDDIWQNWLSYRPEIAERIRELDTRARITEGAAEMIGNMFYAAAMCRVFYRRLPDALPAEDDYEGMAGLWKRRYNTHLGAGTVEKAIPHFKVACTEGLGDNGG